VSRRLAANPLRDDVADAPSGLIGKMEGIFFKLTGVSSVIDNQRGDAEAMFASHIGGKRGQVWADIGPKEQRVLRGFGINEPEWKALHGVEWTKIGDRTYLFPNDALRLSDDQVKAYIGEARPMGAGHDRRHLPSQKCNEAIHDQQKRDHEDKEDGRSVRHRAI